MPKLPPVDRAKRAERVPPPKSGPSLTDAVAWGYDDEVPDGALVVTYSELDAYRQCPLKHQWSYVEKWRETPKDGSALSRGSLWHEMMDAYYTILQLDPDADLDEVFNFIVAHWLTPDPDHGLSNDQELCLWMLQGHIERYGREPDWRILEVERALRVPLGKLQSGRPVYLQAKIDLLVQDSLGAWLVDHKSAKNFSTKTEIDLDDQFGLYEWALEQVGIDCLGTLRSDARTQRNKGPMTLDQRFRREPTHRTSVERANIAHDALMAAQAAHGGHTPVYSATAPDRCGWRCSYKNVHIMARKGSRVDLLMKDYGFKQETEKHREYANSDVVIGLRNGTLHW